MAWTMLYIQKKINQIYSVMAMVIISCANMDNYYTTDYKRVFGTILSSVPSHSCVTLGGVGLRLKMLSIQVCIIHVVLQKS